MSHLKAHGTRATPQSEPLAGQVPNSAGGYAWEITPLDRLRRFLILGSEGGSYYAGQGELTKENVASLAGLMAGADGVAAVELVATVSEQGHAPKNDYAIFALAYAAAEGTPEARKCALDALPRVCRTGAHLFQFVSFLDGSFGKATGRAKRRAIGGWYAQKDPDKLAYQIVKYRQRSGWTHRDVMRLAHPEAPSPGHRALYRLVSGHDSRSGETGELPEVAEGFLKAQASKSAAQTAELVRAYGLPREALLTEHLDAPEVWLAMLETGMPMTALIRNLATMTRSGVIAPGSDGLMLVLRLLGNDESIRRARVHPFNVLNAMATYAAGVGFRGSNTWQPVPQVVDALDAAFYAAFPNVESTGRRFLLGLDVSGSMSHPILNSRLSCRAGAAAMALVTAATEPAYEAVAFTSGGWRQGGGGYGGHRGAGVEAIPLSPRQRLDDATRMIDRRDFGATDCALPMLYAIAHEREVDAFVVYTDSETWHGEVHPAQALREYRRVSGIDARLIVVGMAANGFSIADPNDAGMLDVVGFDTSAPSLIGDFAAGLV